MTATFPLHDEMNAPEAARDALADSKRNFGMIPNLEWVMCSPSTAKSPTPRRDPTRWRPVAVNSGPGGTKCGPGLLITTWHAYGTQL